MSAFPGAPKTGGRIYDSCPTGLCPHPRFLHDVDEIPGVRIERCTVPDCRCSGLVEMREAS